MWGARGLAVRSIIFFRLLVQTCVSESAEVMTKYLCDDVKFRRVASPCLAVALQTKLCLVSSPLDLLDVFNLNRISSRVDESRANDVKQVVVNFPRVDCFQLVR